MNLRLLTIIGAYSAGCGEVASGKRNVSKSFSSYLWN